METFMVDYALPFSMIACIIAAILSLGFPVVQIIKDKNPNVLKHIGIWAGAAIVLYLIGYTMAGDPGNEYLAIRKISASVYTNVSAGITAMMILTGIAFGLIVYSEVKNIFK